MTIYKTSGGEIYTAGIGRIAIIVSGNKPYDDKAWGEYLRFCREMSNPKAPFVAAFNYSPMVGPSAAQRKSFNSELADLNQHFERVVVVSDSTFVRGALTASAWLTRGKMQMRPFMPSKTDEAFAWLAQIAEFSLDEARALLRELVKQQGEDPAGLLLR